MRASTLLLLGSFAVHEGVLGFATMMSFNHHHGKSQLQQPRRLMMVTTTSEDVPNTPKLASSAPGPVVVAQDQGEQAKVANLPRSYLVLALLLLGFASNQWSRQALYYLCDFSPSANAIEHVNIALGFNKEEYAALASFGFTIVFAIFSLFTGTVADKVDRNKIAGLSCLVWSGVTALQSWARSFSDLVPIRVVVGASQSFYNPAAYTLLADIFPKNLIGTVNGVYSSGVYLGGALASLSIILDKAVGWRSTLLIVGSVGIVAAALLFFLIPEPRAAIRRASIDAFTSQVVVSEPPVQTVEPPKSTKDVLDETVAAVSTVLQSYEARLILTAATLRFCAGFSIGIWKAPFVFAKFAGNEAAFAGSNAFIVAVGGLLSSLVGGYLSDRLANPSSTGASDSEGKLLPVQRARARAWIPAVGSLLAAPLWAAFCLSDNPTTAAGFLFLEYLVAECWFGPTLAALFSSVPPSSRGTAQGLFSVLSALGNLAPVVVGAFAGGALGNYALGDVLVVSVCGLYVGCSLLFSLAAVEEDRKISLNYSSKQM